MKVKLYRNRKSPTGLRWGTGTMRHRGTTVRMLWAGPLYVQAWTGKGAQR